MDEGQRFKAIYLPSKGATLERVEYFRTKDAAIRWIREVNNGRVVETATGEIVYNHLPRVDGK